MPREPALGRSLRSLQRRHRACTRCADAGYIVRAHPVFSGRQGQHIMLVGQAPGPVEHDQSRPFAGRAGRQLMRWLIRGGFRDEDDVRDRIYMTAMTTCFPGRRADGAGDRRPSAAEVALCTPWLDGVISMLAPRLIIPIGSLALERFLPGRRLDDVIGAAFTGDGIPILGTPEVSTVLVPLPHPSGQSRWLNDPARIALLDRALVTMSHMVAWADPDG
ncbi:MAG: uracil-DNA glycosylase family protein [Candidatus Dormibacteria bacterium]